MKNSETIKSLKIIVNEYSMVHGETLGELDSWSFDSNLFNSNKKLLKIVLGASPQEIQKNKYVLKIVEHLLSEGFIRSHGGRYFLTKAGIQKGSESVANGFLRRLNENPGFISLLALVISILSLWVSFKKP